MSTIVEFSDLSDQICLSKNEDHLRDVMIVCTALTGRIHIGVFGHGLGDTGHLVGMSVFDDGHIAIDNKLPLTIAEHRET